MYKIIIAFYLLVATANFSTAQDFVPIGKWKTAKSSKGTKLMYRWIMLGDTLKTRQLKVTTTITASPEEILKMLNDSEKLMAWKPEIKEAQVMDKDSMKWTSYMIFDIPSLFPQQDLIVSYKVESKEDSLTIIGESFPNRLEEIKGVNRQKIYYDKWILRPINEHSSKLTYTSIAPGKPIMPRFIQDKFLQPMIISSFAMLKNKSEENNSLDSSS
ncbi:hypothetical protein [Aureibacter tunicatorum]|uniref:START domain-containing protein n=1 Tax=Aureibacter tunicatorum TaxID=866807 RepID=A0AAE4BRJ3_9BACT|nr:hypothetical protein [Aureibacter tunicatorum]MDR6237865.1 hypothetical protein [Aureibacter tunicatorum]BDD02900.1 hypothetical protein AUTU_03830 [Aureibacter tunicatorum]